MSEAELSVFKDAVVNGLFALVVAVLSVALGDLVLASLRAAGVVGEGCKVATVSSAHSFQQNRVLIHLLVYPLIIRLTNWILGHRSPEIMDCTIR